MGLWLVSIMKSAQCIIRLINWANQILCIRNLNWEHGNRLSQFIEGAEAEKTKWMHLNSIQTIQITENTHNVT